MSTQTLHFTVGEDAGILVMKIAQEYLLYTNDVEKALKTITDSLMGCPMDLALNILVGDYLILVDVEEQQFMVTERDNSIHTIFPKIDVFNWCRTQSIDISKNADDLIQTIKQTAWNLRGTKLHVSFDYKEIFDFIGGDDDTILDEIRDNEDVIQLMTLVRVVKEFIDKSLKVSKVIDWLIRTYPNKFSHLDGNISDIYMVNYRIAELSEKFNSMLLTNWSAITGITIDVDNIDNTLTKYIDAVKEIDEVISNGIEPVDIMDNYSAGWLSPDGVYYALNGEIANMLHIQIADALQEKGIIPTNDEDGKVNPDSWLEQNGWVKIHGNSVHYAGCLNKEIGLKNVDLTNVQIDIIYKYIQLKHNGIMKLGWKLQPTSAAKFQMLAENNLPFLYKNYFEF